MFLKLKYLQPCSHQCLWLCTPPPGVREAECSCRLTEFSVYRAISAWFMTFPAVKYPGQRVSAGQLWSGESTSMPEREHPETPSWSGQGWIAAEPETDEHGYHL